MVVASGVLVVGVAVIKAVVVVDKMRVVGIVVETVTSHVVIAEVDWVVVIGLLVVTVEVIVGPTVIAVGLLAGSVTAVAALVAGFVETCVVGV